MYSIAAFAVMYLIARNAAPPLRITVLVLLIAGLLYHVTGFYSNSIHALLDLRTGGRPRLPNPVLDAGDRLHDRLDPLHPTLLHWNGRSLLVRPDRVVARAGELPHLAEVHVRDERRPP